MKIRTYILYFLLILFLIVLPSCQQSTPPEDLPAYINNSDENIFAGGYSIPALYGSEYGYWLNNAWTMLEHDNDRSITFDKKPMIDNANNVYITGKTKDDKNHEEYGYWKNGKWIAPDFLKNLTCLFINIDKKGNIGFCFQDAEEHLGYIVFNEASSKYTTTMLKMKAEAKGVQITSKPYFDSNGNVYIGGCYMDKNSDVQPCYWKNDTMIPLERAYKYSGANVFYISHIYINENSQLFFFQTQEKTGEKWKDTCYSDVNGYWSRVKFQDTSDFKIIDFLEKDGCLYTLVNVNRSYKSVLDNLYYFKDTKSYSISRGANITHEDFCMTKSEDIYVAVTKENEINYQAGYIKNDEFVQLKNPKSAQDSSYTYGIEINGDNICVTGSIYYGQKQACYWKNGQYNKLTNPYGDQYNSSVTTIFEDNEKNLYCAGYCCDGKAYKCGYWKNGEWNVDYTSNSASVADEYRLFYNPKGDFLIHKVDHDIWFNKKHYFYHSSKGYFNMPYHATLIEGSSSGLRVYLDNEGNIYIPEWLESEGAGYRKITLSEEETFTKFSYTNEDTEGMDTSASWLNIYNGDVYSEIFCNFWKNNEKILEHDDCYYYDYLLHNSDGIPVFAGRAYDPADIPESEGCYLFYFVDGKYSYCENPQNSLGPELYDFVITKNGDYLFAGNASYNNWNWYNEKIPGIWTNGVWGSLQTPYDNQFGCCRCLFATK